MTPDFIVSVDLGQAADFTAVGGLRRVSVPTGKTREQGTVGGLEMVREYEDAFTLGYAQRFPLHTPYPEQVERLVQICTKIQGSYQVVADATGVGRPVVQMMKDAGLPVVGIIITGGVGSATLDRKTNYWHVPKRELVTRAQTYMQQKKLRFSDKVPLSQTIATELQAFKMRISAVTGNVSFEAWRDHIHDDLVLMLCMGVWWGHHTRKQWKKDHGPHSTLDSRNRDQARKHFALDASEPEW